LRLVEKFSRFALNGSITFILLLIALFCFLLLVIGLLCSFALCLLRCFACFFASLHGLLYMVLEALLQIAADCFLNRFLCFAAYHFNCTFVAGGCTGAAAITFFFINSNDFSNHTLTPFQF